MSQERTYQRWKGWVRGESTKERQNCRLPRGGTIVGHKGNDLFGLKTAEKEQNDKLQRKRVVQKDSMISQDEGGRANEKDWKQRCFWRKVFQRVIVESLNSQLSQVGNEAMNDYERLATKLNLTFIKWDVYAQITK